MPPTARRVGADVGDTASRSSLCAGHRVALARRRIAGAGVRHLR
ncbi:MULTISPECIES: hypothetical protein [unclassified Frankia]|nr:MULTISPECIES: hypothetical protein [unclassified Frankia]